MRPWVLPVVFFLVVCFGIGLVVVEGPKQPERMVQVRSGDEVHGGQKPSGEVTRTESGAQESSQDDEEVLRRARLFAGASVKEIADVWGGPDSTIHLLGNPGPQWEYKDRPTKYNTMIFFDEHNRAHEVRSYTKYILGDPYYTRASNFLPKELVESEPNRIYLDSFHLQVYCVWDRGGRTYIAAIVSGSGGEVITKTRRLNTSTGLYENNISVGPSDWRNGDLVEFNQWNLPNKMPSGAMQYCEQVKGSPPPPTFTEYDCGRNLSNVSGAASYVHIMEGRYPSLAELKKTESMKCPVSGQAYIYDQNTGNVSCPSHKNL